MSVCLIKSNCYSLIYSSLIHTINKRKEVRANLFQPKLLSIKRLRKSSSFIYIIGCGSWFLYQTKNYVNNKPEPEHRYLKGKCFIMTANLDGESNLKPKLAVKETRKYMNVSFLNNLTGYIQCQNPNPDLSSFTGTLHISKEYGLEQCSIGIENLGI